MRLAYFTKQVALNGQPVLQAFLTGCQTLGITTVENSLDCDAAVIWSMVWSGRMAKNFEIYQSYTLRQLPVFVLEVGMIHRDRTWKLGVNGTTANAVWVPSYDLDRPRKLGLVVKPWRTRGREIVVMGQRGDSGQWGFTDPTQWYQSKLSEIQQYSDRPLLFRPHPRFPVPSWENVQQQRPRRLAGTYDSYDFDNAIGKAWAVVNFNSGPGSQAIINGVPAFVDQSSLAATVGNIDLTQIENPNRPDRNQWICDIAHTEWSISELVAGMPQKKLLDRNIFHAS